MFPLLCCLVTRPQTPAAVHTACLPPATNVRITCKLCCIHSAQTALIWALSMSTCAISVLVLALVWVLVILFCSLALFLLYSLGKSVWVWNQALPSALRSLVEVKHESMRVHVGTDVPACTLTHARAHTYIHSRLSGFPEHLLLY